MCLLDYRHVLNITLFNGAQQCFHTIIILNLILLLQIHRKGTYKMPIWHYAHLIIISGIIIMGTWGSPLRVQGL